MSLKRDKWSQLTILLDCMGLMSRISTSTAMVGLLCLPSRCPSLPSENIEIRVRQ